MQRRSIFIFLILLFSANFVFAQGIVINEIAWMGTEEDSNNEWIELFNKQNENISLNEWILKIGDKNIMLEGIIKGNDFFILERSDDNTLPQIKANQIYTGSLKNSGEIIKLIDTNGNIIDEINFTDGWPCGDNETKQTMERIEDEWQNSLNIGGSPNAQNIKYEKPKDNIKTESIVLENNKKFPLSEAIFFSLISGLIILFCKKSFKGNENES